MNLPPNLQITEGWKYEKKGKSTLKHLFKLLHFSIFKIIYYAPRSEINLINNAAIKVIYIHIQTMIHIRFMSLKNPINVILADINQLLVIKGTMTNMLDVVGRMFSTVGINSSVLSGGQMN